MNLTGKVQDDLKSISRKPEDVSGRKLPRVWVMVADRHIAKIFRKIDGKLEFIGEAVSNEAPAGLSNKTVGRVTSGGAFALHHKYEPPMNQSRKEEFSFAHAVAEWLDTAVGEDAFDRLVLVAGPEVLGDLRKTITQRAHARIVAEVPKTLTRFDTESLQKELAKIEKF